MKKDSKLFFYLICIYTLIFPLYTQEVKSGLNINGSDVILGIIFILYLFMIFINKFVREKFLYGVKHFLKDPLTIFAFILAFIMLISTSYALNKKLAFTETIRFLVYIAVYFIIRYEIHWKNTKSILVCYISSVLAVCLFGLIQKYTRIGFNKKFLLDYGYGEIIRIHSTLINPNALGAFLVLAIFPIIVLIFGSKNNIIHRIIYTSIALIIIANIIMSGSRNAIIALGIGLIVLAIIYNKKIIGLIILGSIGGLSFKPTRYRILDIFSKKQNVSRIKLWETAIAMIKEHPIMGVGNGNYVTRYNEYIKKYPNLRYSNWRDFPAHNSYLKIQSELGIIGITSFLGLLICSVKKVYSLLKITEDNFIKAFYTGFLASMISFLVMNFFDNMLFIPQVAMSYWIIVAISDSFKNNALPKERMYAYEKGK